MPGTDASTSNCPALQGAIVNPANPAHLMILRPVNRTVRVYADGHLIAQTKNALRVMEMSKTLYDPALYIPAEDITAEFTPLDKTSHCPLKGDASYVALNGDEIAWTYDLPLDGAEQLDGRFAFWPDRVKIAEGD